MAWSCSCMRAPGATTTMRCCGDSAATKAGIFRLGQIFTTALKPLLDLFGARRDFTLILFTLDESTYSREFGTTGGTLPLPAAGTGVVVPRRTGRHAALPAAARPRRPDFTIPRDSTTTRAHFSQFRHATLGNEIYPPSSRDDLPGEPPDVPARSEWALSRLPVVAVPEFRKMRGGVVVNPAVL